MCCRNNFEDSRQKRMRCRPPRKVASKCSPPCATSTRNVKRSSCNGYILQLQSSHTKVDNLELGWIYPAQAIHCGACGEGDTNRQSSTALKNNARARRVPSENQNNRIKRLYKGQSAQTRKKNIVKDHYSLESVPSPR